MTDPADVTLVKNAIHNPAEPRHFMRVTRSGTRRTASIGDRVVADSENAVLVKEVGRDIYDAVVYFDRADVDMAALSAIDKSTHCPLKGDTEYFDIVIDGDRHAEAAWSYVQTLDIAAELQDLVAFDASQVTIA